MQIKVVLQAQMLLRWTFDDLRSSTRGVKNSYLKMSRFHVECVMGKDISLMDFIFLNLVGFCISSMALIIVNDLMTPFDGLERSIYNLLQDTIH